MIVVPDVLWSAGLGRKAASRTASIGQEPRRQRSEDGSREVRDAGEVAELPHRVITGSVIPGIVESQERDRAGTRFRQTPPR